MKRSSIVAAWFTTFLLKAFVNLVKRRLVTVFRLQPTIRTLERKRQRTKRRTGCCQLQLKLPNLKA